MKSPATLLVSCLFALFALQAPAFADPAGRARLRAVLAEHGTSEPLVVLSELAREGSFSIDEADVVAAATATTISPALRTVLSNTRTIGVAEGRLVLNANREFEVPTQNGGALRFAKRFGIAPGAEGRAEVRGLKLGPQRFADNRNPVRTALLDRDGVYGFDVGTGAEPREVWFRPRVEPAAQPADAQPADAQPADAQPVDAQPVDAQPVDAQPRVEQPPLDQPRVEQPPLEPTPSPHAEEEPASQPDPTKVEELSPAERYQTGLHVLALEKALAQLGYEVTPDRFFGWQTQKALSDFQSENGLPSSGALDAGTIAAIQRQLPSASEAQPPVEAAAEAEPARSRPHPEAEAEVSAPPAEAAQGSEDRLRQVFGLESEGEGGSAEFRPLGPESEGIAVRDLQRRLRAAGQDLRADGKFGPATTAALERFQREHGLEPSGTLDAETDAALTDAARAPRVAEGDSGAAARRLQEALRRRGARLSADGQFGPKSVAALKSFQRESGLEPTGVADAATWEALDTLRRGDRGDDVRELQEALNRVRAAQGKDPITVDGRFGPGTEEAIQELQAELGEPESGQVSPQLQRSLRRANLQGIVAEAEASEREKAPVGGLAEGDRGEQVKALQQELRRHGIPLNPDGNFGPGTRQALERFQRENDLPVTGRADEATLNAVRGLVRGDRGEDVKDLQRLINHQRRIAGLDELPIDGKYGAGTAEAIAEIQRDLELDPTGRADKPLIDALTTARDQDTQPILRPGDQGNSVTRLQQRLNVHREAVGLPKIRVTGNFDPATVTALATFQRERGLDSSGESNEATWELLDGQPPADLEVRPLREGDVHDEVALLQDKLNQVRRWRGQGPIGVDGHFGGGTRTALEGFQRQSNLPVTGQADAETVAALDQLTAGTFTGDFPQQERYAPFSAEARQLFVAAARLIGVPEEWAHSNGLHQILKRESDGWVGIPNYTYGSRKSNRSAWASVHEELRRGRKRAKSSATGLGQLLLGNVDKYYPQGRAGIGDALNEAAGMLAYIKDRYRTPARAWSLYGKLHEGY